MELRVAKAFARIQRGEHLRNLEEMNPTRPFTCFPSSHLLSFEPFLCQDTYRWMKFYTGRCALRKLAIAALFTLLSALSVAGIGTQPAQAQSVVNFTITNNTSYAMMLKFYSRDGSWVWPSSTTHYPLNDNRDYTFPLACTPGEVICYGGAWNVSDNPYWGIGFFGRRGCTGCCLSCGGAHHYNLVD